MPKAKKGIIAAVAVLLIMIFPNAMIWAEDEEATPEEKAEVIRNLIIQLNSTYSSLNKSLKELEEGIGALPDTILNISVRKRGKDIELLSLDIQDNDKPFESHLYLPAENEALNAGARHQIYHGAIRDGTHKLKVTYYWKEETSTQKGEAVIPITIMLGKSYFIDLSILKTGDRVQLLYSQLDFDSR